jgi:deoxyribodipyrimidine photo-lyase
MKALVWFRSDLRVCDNTALHHACKTSDEGAIGLFVISPAEWRAHDVSPARIDLVLRTLGELSASLARLNIPLLIAMAAKPADVPSAVLDAARTHGCTRLFYNREYELNESRRDRAIDSLFRTAGLETHSFTDQVVIEPGQLLTGEGKFYSVFTPFKRAWIKATTERGGITTLPAPPKQPRQSCEPSPIPASVPGFVSTVPARQWPAGESHARKQLDAFIAKQVNVYKALRDSPAVDGTSALSPYLAIGAISPRQCIIAAAEANTNSRSPLDSGNEGIVHWISEVLWREFYVHVMVGWPRVCMHRAFQPTTEAIRWNDNDDHLKAWQEGKTGVPIVDAGMRQLLATGWMHNRVRMITAMYFSKNLFLDWRLGEKHFMRHLVDGTLASNNGGWQWSASTGTDAAPYFRIFNPVSQSRKFDPEGEYIRRYMPELRHLSAEAIHDPWEAAPLLAGKDGYPRPLVDLGSSRVAAIEAFKNIRG